MGQRPSLLSSLPQTSPQRRRPRFRRSLTSAQPGSLCARVRGGGDGRRPRAGEVKDSSTAPAPRRGAPDREARRDARVLERGLLSPGPAPGPGLQRDPVPERRRRGARPRVRSAINSLAVTSTSLPLSQEIRVLPRGGCPRRVPGRQPTRGAGVEAGSRALPTRKGAGAAPRRPPGVATSVLVGGLVETSGCQVSPRLSEGPVPKHVWTRGPDRRARRVPTGATRGPLLRTPLCVRGVEMSTESPSGPSEVPE